MGVTGKAVFAVRALQETQPPSEELGAELDRLTAMDYLWAAGILVVGIVLARIGQRLFVRIMTRRSSSQFTAKVLGRLLAAVIVAGAVVHALNRLEISVGLVLGALGVAGIALAFAPQNILENVIAGLLILLRRPFRPGDQIETGGYEGIVTDITLRAVAIRTYENVSVLVPSATVWKDAIVNNTAYGVRRTTLMVGVSYSADPDEARKIIAHALGSVEGVRADPAPQVYVERFGESSVDLAVHFWHDPTKAAEWEVRDRVARAVERALDGAGIEIPFPQRTLHLADPWPGRERNGATQ